MENLIDVKPFILHQITPALVGVITNKHNSGSTNPITKPSHPKPKEPEDFRFRALFWEIGKKQT
ncbi:hypothetical protein [Nibribacter koreensis]|uniref:Uncharacterized protein n=1 Tax=Nibribacter koreensis TaxID=1084519 RepID=A0ABP8FM54_9BACT